ncbi:SEFIR domain protein [Legionella rubrilucens]|uniref:SEFIR domain protein n=1 Tax=Legionella rubrilucens TaxID=458 RepID=A0A0W0XUM5_9GAMM|nr:SEFIR domain-containing protein [Legionella rubrilucens]KTD48363.1 SEFIR domain protein [Legionella rubrilucens]
MNEKTTPRVFISYSHESSSHIEEVRNIADILIQEYGIDVIGDFYEEDNPTGGLLTIFMQGCRQADRIIAILSPTYKTKANEGKGGVGYESSIITDDLYKNILSDKVIPVLINEGHSFEESCPDFLMTTRKAIIKQPNITTTELVEEIARVIHQQPKKPKPPLGRNKLKDEKLEIQVVDDININKLIKDDKRILNTAKYFADREDYQNFNLLFKEIKEYVFKSMNDVKEKTIEIIPKSTDKDLPDIMKHFVDTASPLFLVALGGVISRSKNFQNQEGLLIDLLSMDDWWIQNNYEILRTVPELLAFVYHHVYGALLIYNGRLHEVSSIFKQKIPIRQPSIHYEYLYNVPSVTGFIKSLGRDYTKSFNFMLSSYSNWSWLKLLFKTEEDWMQALVNFQMTMNILFYFQSLSNKTLTSNKDEIFNNPVIPPSFIIANRKYKNTAFHYLIKNSVFFKNFLKKIEITSDEACSRWNEFLKMMGYFYDFNLRECTMYDTKFMDSLMK